MQTDVYKTLKALQEAGEKGIHSFDLNHIVGTTRCAARVSDLKHQNHHIYSKPEVLNGTRGVRYFLMDKPTPKPQYIFREGVCIQI